MATSPNNAQINKLYEYVDLINAVSYADDHIGIDGSKSLEGVRVWRVGRPSQSYIDMTTPDRSTVQMLHYLQGVLDRQKDYQGRTVRQQSSGDNKSQSASLGKAVVQNLPAYVDEHSTMFILDSDESHCYQVSNHKLDAESYHMVQIHLTGDSQYITNTRVAAPFEIDWSDFTVYENTDLVVPDFDSDNGGIFYPVINPTFKLDPQLDLMLEFMLYESAVMPQKAIISGEPATGKTTSVQQFAAKHNRPVFQMSCGLIESSPEFIGLRTVGDDGKIAYQPSGLMRALQTPGCVIIMDEYNRLHPTLQNSLYNILDDFGQTFVGFEYDKVIRVASGVIIIATMNIGAKHTGTFALDDAMADRFPYHLKMDYLSAEDEIDVIVSRTGCDTTIARKMVEIANQTRSLASDPDNDSAIDSSISLRQLLAMGQMIAHGLGPIQAASFAVFNDYSNDGGEASAQAAVRELFQGKFG